MKKSSKSTAADGVRDVGRLSECVEVLGSARSVYALNHPSIKMLSGTLLDL
jgi:hypothetical protein